jgi:hypothetical protein
MSSIAQSTRSKSLASTEILKSTSSADQDDTSVRTVSHDPEAEAIIKGFQELGEKVRRPMKVFDQQSATLAPNEQQGGNANKPGN